jgi:hypothetical protein
MLTRTELGGEELRQCKLIIYSDLQGDIKDYWATEIALKISELLFDIPPSWLGLIQIGSGTLWGHLEIHDEYDRCSSPMPMPVVVKRGKYELLLSIRDEHKASLLIESRHDEEDRYRSLHWSGIQLTDDLAGMGAICCSKEYLC